jgi:resuscitation-promoting factor RpfB
LAEQATRASRWLVPALVCALIVGVWVYVDTRAPLEVRVDGQLIRVTDPSLTVGEVLVEEGVAVGPYDVVEPAMATPVTQGLEVDIDRALPVQIDDDGTISTVWTTADTVADLLVELDRRPAEVTPPPDAPVPSGGVVVLRSARSVAVDAGGVRTMVVGTGRTVAEVLAAAGISVDSDDEVQPALTSGVAHGGIVTIVRVERVTETVEARVEAGTVVIDDPSLARGVERVRDAGAAGVVRQTVQVERRDGVETSRTVLAEEAVSAPRDRVVVRGTRAATTTTTAATTATTAPADATPTPTTAAPPPETTTTTVAPPPASGSDSGGATWYRTYSGTCAHRTLPRGTIVTITSVATGATATCRVADAGPFADGRIIDLAQDVFVQLAPLSTGVVQVTISW